MHAHIISKDKLLQYLYLIGIQTKMNQSIWKDNKKIPKTKSDHESFKRIFLETEKTFTSTTLSI